MDERLHGLIERAGSWPAEARARLLLAAEEIEQTIDGVHVLSRDELEAIKEGLEDIRQGRIASDAEMEALFAQCR